MKKITILLLVIPLFSWGQVYQKFPDNDSSYIGLVPMPYIIPCCINIDSIFKARHVKILKATHVELINMNQKPKWYSISKNDLWVMGMEVGAGYCKGWQDEIEFHHYELSQRFPGLFKNGNRFWDGRYDDDGIWDAKHMMAGLTAGFHVAAVVIKFGDIKRYPKKDRWKKIVFDTIKFYGAYKLGFFLGYNVTNQNSLFK